jgi:hypothetical protein
VFSPRLFEAESGRLSSAIVKVFLVPLQVGKIRQVPRRSSFCLSPDYVLSVTRPEYRAPQGGFSKQKNALARIALPASRYPSRYPHKKCNCQPSHHLPGILDIHKQNHDRPE